MNSVFQTACGKNQDNVITIVMFDFAGILTVFVTIDTFEFAIALILCEFVTNVPFANCFNVMDAESDIIVEVGRGFKVLSAARV